MTDSRYGYSWDDPCNNEAFGFTGGSKISEYERPYRSWQYLEAMIDALLEGREFSHIPTKRS